MSAGRQHAFRSEKIQEDNMRLTRCMSHSHHTTTISEIPPRKKQHFATAPYPFPSSPTYLGFSPPSSLFTHFHSFKKSHLVLLSRRHHGVDFARQIPLHFSLIGFLQPRPSTLPPGWRRLSPFPLPPSSKSVKSYQLQERRKACWVSEATEGHEKMQKILPSRDTS